MRSDWMPGHPRANAANTRVGGFTLIELLTVIGIIAILAALLIGSAMYASRSVKERRVRAELSRLVTAIEAYKAHFGFFPPDNPARPDQPPLLYELTGTYLDTSAGAEFVLTGGAERISSGLVSTYFGVEGFANATRNPSEAKSFLTDLKASQYSTNLSGADPGALLLNVPVPGTNPAFPRFNPWRYVSTRPTNNPGRFDLWAEVVIGGQTHLIGNWK